jgi:hypothetical protein
MVILVISLLGVNSRTTLCKHSTDSTSTFTALRNVNTTTRTAQPSSLAARCRLIRSPDSPVRSQSLYRLRYPAHSREGMQENSAVPYVFACWKYLKMLLIPIRKRKDKVVYSNLNVSCSFLVKSFWCLLCFTKSRATVVICFVVRRDYRNLVMRSSIICSLRPILFEWSDEGWWDRWCT